MTSLPTLHISDIHENMEKLALILKKIEYNHVIFHGDYVDGKDGKHSITKCEYMLYWINQHIFDKDKTFLIGNHDLQYLYPMDYYNCSNYDYRIREMIKNHELFKPERRERLLFHVTHNGFLCSHAGLHPSFELKDLPSNKELHELCLKKKETEFLGVGYNRGGYQPYGGLTWLDWKSEFEPRKDIKQIVGHTRNTKKSIRENDGNFCIESDLQEVLLTTETNITRKVKVKILR